MKSSQFIPLGFTWESFQSILRVKRSLLMKSSQFIPQDLRGKVSEGFYV